MQIHQFQVLKIMNFLNYLSQIVLTDHFNILHIFFFSDQSLQFFDQSSLSLSNLTS